MIDPKCDISPSVNNAIENTTDAPTKVLGKGLADIFDLVFQPIGYHAEIRRLKYAEKLKNFKKRLDKKTSSIPSENLQEPNLQVVGNALEATKYCLESDELQEMFANLISSSMDNRFCNETHPSFAEIIRQMSPLDAQNLALFKDNDYIVAEYRVNSDNNGYKVVATNIFISNPQESNLDLQAASISNLARLGLVNIDYSTYGTNETAYDIFKQTDFFKEYESRNNKTLKIQKGIVQKTPLGKSFIHVCLP